MNIRVKLLIGIITTWIVMGCQHSSIEYSSFDEYPVYNGDDLGLTYTTEKSIFKLWSPTAEEVKLNVYAEGDGGMPVDVHAMELGDGGAWIFELEGDHQGRFYTFQIKINEQWLEETPGPYAKATGVNGKRAYILDLTTTDPEGWENDSRPDLASYNDILVYEIHIRDMSVHPSSGIANKGKFLGLTETGRTSPTGEKTGVDHLKELGITHVHVLPMFDFRSIDESKLEENKFNWGYEPLNYNVPEGSYATDPYQPEVRIRELKQMIQTLHQNGIRVIMDVVYNHTGFGDAGQYSFSLSVPEYYYRYNEDGSLSDASACGNETASERPMMRKYMLESVKYWIEEYHLDGFRFDLMGIHDVETMNQISSLARSIDPSIFVYGEGWKAGSSPLPDSLLALKSSMPNVQHVAAFSDEIRDGLKGSWNDWEAPGFVSGNADRIEGVKFGIVGGTNHPEVDYKKVNESNAPWANNPDQCMVYVSCHDNHTLYDKLKVVNPEATEDDILRMHVLANTVVLTSQGIPFLHAGVDFVRTKQGVENSYDSPDSINQIDWNRKTTYKNIFNFYQNLINLRKDHPAFRMSTTEMVQEHLTFLDFKSKRNLIGYKLSGNANGDSWEEILLIFNGSSASQDVPIPEGSWTKVLQGTDVNQSGISSFSGASAQIPAYSAIMLVDSKSI